MIVDVEIIDQDYVRSLSFNEINELMIAYRDQWTTPQNCMRIIMNCNIIMSVYGSVGLVETTRMEASMRGQMLLKLAK